MAKTDVEAAVRAAVQRRIDQAGLTITHVAERIGMSSTTVSQYLKGTYPANSRRVAAALERWLKTDQELVDAGFLRRRDRRHVELDITASLQTWCRHAQANGDLVVIYGMAGTGKTWSLQRYAEETTAAWHVAMSPSLTTAAAVLSRIARAIGTGGDHRTAARLEQAVIDRLSGIDAVLLVDESHHLPQALLDVLRCVHDAAECGLVLAGNEPLWSRLASGERAAQLVSRVGLRRRLRRPSAADALTLARHLLERDVAQNERKTITATAAGPGGLRAVRKLIGQARVLAAAEDREAVEAQDIQTAAAYAAAEA